MAETADLRPTNYGRQLTDCWPEDTEHQEII